MAGRIDARLKELGIELPAPSAPVANYVPYVMTGHLVFVSGQVSMAGGEKITGTVGGNLSVEQGQAAAPLCGVTILAPVKADCGGDRNRVRRWVKSTEGRRVGGGCVRK